MLLNTDHYNVSHICVKSRGCVNPQHLRVEPIWVNNQRTLCQQFLSKYSRMTLTCRHSQEIPPCIHVPPCGTVSRMIATGKHAADTDTLYERFGLTMKYDVLPRNRCHVLVLVGSNTMRFSKELLKAFSYVRRMIFMRNIRALEVS